MLFKKFKIDDDLKAISITQSAPSTTTSEPILEIAPPLSPIPLLVTKNPFVFISPTSNYLTCLPSPITSVMFSPNNTSSMMIHTSSSSGLNTSQSNVFSSISFDESYEYVPCSGIVNKNYFKNCGDNFELPETLVLRTSDNFTYESTDCKRNILDYKNRKHTRNAVIMNNQYFYLI